MGIEQSVIQLKPSVLNEIRKFAKAMVADSDMLSPRRLTIFANSVCGVASSRGCPRQKQVCIFSLCLQSILCTQKIAEHLHNKDIDFLAVACHQCSECLRSRRLSYVAYVAHCGALSAWPKISRCSSDGLAQALRTSGASISLFGSAETCTMEPHRLPAFHKSLRNVDCSVEALSRMVAALAWLTLAPDRYRFGFWLLDQIHESYYPEEQLRKPPYFIRAYIERPMGVSPIELEEDSEEFQQLFFEAYAFLELQVQATVQMRARQIFSAPL